MNPIAFYRQLRAAGLDEASAMKAAEQFAERAEAELRATYEGMIERAFAMTAEVKASASDANGRQARNRRYYEKRKASEIKTPERLNASENVLDAKPEIKTEERLKASESVLNSDAPRARGLDNPLRVVDNHTALNGETRERADAVMDADGWPVADPGEYLTDTLTKLLLPLCGPRMGDPAKDGRLAMSATAMAQWRKAGCSWEEDVIPTVRALSRTPGDRIKTWSFFTEAILDQASRRKAELVIPGGRAHVRGSSAPTAADRRRADYDGRLADIGSAAAAAVRESVRASRG